jgi:hypothetical protein
MRSQFDGDIDTMKISIQPDANDFTNFDATMPNGVTCLDAMSLEKVDMDFGTLPRIRHGNGANRNDER